jgi:hypothetical protein
MEARAIKPAFIDDNHQRQESEKRLYCPDLIGDKTCAIEGRLLDNGALA